MQCESKLFSALSLFMYCHRFFCEPKVSYLNYFLQTTADASSKTLLITNSGTMSAALSVSNSRRTFSIFHFIFWKLVCDKKKSPWFIPLASEVEGRLSLKSRPQRQTPFHCSLEDDLVVSLSSWNPLWSGLMVWELSLFECHPLSWTGEILEGNCVEGFSVYYCICRELEGRVIVNLTFRSTSCFWSVSLGNQIYNIAILHDVAVNWFDATSDVHSLFAPSY